MQDKIDHIKIIEIGDGGKLWSFFIKDKGTVFFSSGKTYLEEYEKEEAKNRPYPTAHQTFNAARDITGTGNFNSQVDVKILPLKNNQLEVLGIHLNEQILF